MKQTSGIWPDDGVVLYDGICVLCSRWTKFIVGRDRNRRFRFTAIQSPYGRAMAEALGIDPAEPDTNAVVFAGKVFRRSDAAIVVLEHLPGWRWAAVFWIIPPVVRDAVYSFVARNRYGFFGRYSACDLNPSALTGRVLVDL
ncbi:MAG: DCC1-like thiol-disulfide oxidoreductase family protein [Pseudomonadota bacterium]